MEFGSEKVSGYFDLTNEGIVECQNLFKYDNSRYSEGCYPDSICCYMESIR